MLGKTELEKVIQQPIISAKNPVEEEKNQIELNKKDDSKLVIQLNLGKQSFHQDEVTQIIREIFDMSNHSVEIERGALPANDGKWEVRKMDSLKEKEGHHLAPSSSIINKSKKSSKTKLVKYGKLYRVTSLKSLIRLRHGSRRKMSANPSRESGSSHFSISPVHSSSAITNLLSQLYPNPYNLISSMEVRNKSKNSMGSKGAVNGSQSCKINFHTKHGLKKDSEQEFGPLNVPDVFYKNIYDESFDNCNQQEKCKTNLAEENCAEKKKSQSKNDIFMISKTAQTQYKVEDAKQKVKVSVPISEDTQTGNGEISPPQEVHPRSKNPEEQRTEIGKETQTNMAVPTATQNQKRCKMKESKELKKNAAKTASATVEKTEEDKCKRKPVKTPEPSRDKFCNTKIHPVPIQAITTRKVNPNSQQSTKKKDVIQYLKLIKNLYEQEEKSLQCKIDDAWYFALNRIEKSKKTSPTTLKKRKGLESVQKPIKEKEFKNSQSQTSTSQKNIVGKKSPNPVSRQNNEEPNEHTKVPVYDNPEIIGTILSDSYKSKSSSKSYGHRKDYQLTMLKNPYNNLELVTGKPTTIRTGTFAFSRKIMKNESSETEELPIEIINRNARKTNRKIDLLIKHIDNSMNWLSQSENNKPSSINSLVEEAKDLSEKLEENLRTQEPSSVALSETNMKSVRLYRHKNMTFSSSSNLLLAPSYESLHIFPVNRLGNLRIRTGTFFDNDMRNRDSLWRGPSTVRRSSMNGIIIPHSKSANYLTSHNRVTMLNRTMPVGGNVSIFQGTVDSEIPELHTTTEQTMFYIENTNEHGSLTENVNVENQQRKHASASNNTEVANRISSNVFNMDSKSLPSSLSVSIIALEESLSAMRPVIMQEITWSFPVPVSSPVLRMHCLHERHMIYTTAEANVLHVARIMYFTCLVLTSVVQVVEQEQEQQFSVITSPHECSSFVENNDQPGQVCESVDLLNHMEKNSQNMVTTSEEGQEMSIRVLKGAGSKMERIRKKWERYDWDSFLSESSLEFSDRDRAPTGDLDAIMKRPDRYEKNLEWLNPVLDPYESNPGDEMETPALKKTNLQAMSNAPLQGYGIQDGVQEIFSELNKKNRRSVKFSDLEPPLFRYYSSETSSTSLDERKKDKVLELRKTSDHTRKTSKLPNGNFSLFPEIKKTGENTSPLEKKKEEKEENDSSSTSSFKSSNDLSDVSDQPELNYSKKRPKSRSHYLDKLFHEIRSFRKCLTRQKGPKRKTAQDDSNEFHDALSDLNTENQENKCTKSGERDVGGIVSSAFVDEARNLELQRKIFKTSFRGKESVTELMIDFKDASISEVSDISVEKRKLSTDHTKISILISKPAEGKCYSDESHRNRESPNSFKSLKDTPKLNFLDWNEATSLSDEDTYDDDYLSAHSCTESRSLENIRHENPQDNSKDKKFTRDDLIEAQKKGKLLKRHKFDFYKKMENTSFNGSEMLFSKYEKEIAPLQKTLADMQFRIHNVQKKTFCTSDEYYERALRMAKMSAGYCQLCKSKTVIPEDPLGIYQNLIPRTSFYSPYSNHRKYYFKTSSTNSSFYSIHSSNSDISDKFCHLNSSSSIITNRLTRNRRPMLQESTSNNIPVFFGRTVRF